MYEGEFDSDYKGHILSGCGSGNNRMYSLEWLYTNPLLVAIAGIIILVCNGPGDIDTINSYSY